MAQFAVIGLGSFGGSAAQELMRLGHEVIGLDKDAKNVNRLSSVITFAAIADATDESVLKELNLQHCEAVLVAIGEDIEASILCVVHLKNLGIEKILVKAKTSAHHMILNYLNVTKIIHPEEQMGIRVAQALNYPMVNQYMSLGAQHFIVLIDTPKHLQGLSVRRLIDTYPKITVIMLIRDEKFIKEFSPDMSLNVGDTLVLEGHLTELSRLAKKFKE